MRLSEVTVKEHLYEIKRFCAWLKEDKVSSDTLRDYLKQFSESSPYTYSNVLKSLKRFFRNFLREPQLVDSFRFPNKPLKLKIIPGKHDLQRFYEALEKPIEMSFFISLFVVLLFIDVFIAVFGIVIALIVFFALGEVYSKARYT